MFVFEYFHIGKKLITYQPVKKIKIRQPCLWSLAFIRRSIYTFLNMCPFDYTVFVISGKVGIP